MKNPNFHFTTGIASPLNESTEGRRYFVLPKSKAKPAQDFRETAADLAGKLQQSERAALMLASELIAADQIIRTMQRYLTVSQKIHVGVERASLSIDADERARNRERQVVLRLVTQQSEKNNG